MPVSSSEIPTPLPSRCDGDVTAAGAGRARGAAVAEGTAVACRRGMTARSLCALLLVAAPPALACTPPCEDATLAPPDHATIPASAPALALDATTFGYPIDALRVETVDGQPVAVTVTAQPSGQEWLITPAQPFAAGDYRAIAPRPSCLGQPPDGGPATLAHPFTVGAGAPLPTQMGAASAMWSRLAMVQVSNSNGSCVSTIPAAVSDVAITFADEMKPWLPLARLTLAVDGMPWAQTAYGDVAADGAMRGHAGETRTITSVFGACLLPPMGVDGGLVIGPHHADLIVEIAGAQANPQPIGFDFTLSCSNFAGDDPFGFEGDLYAQGSGDMGAGDGHVQIGQVGCGCAVGARPPRAPIALALALLALGALVRVARRRAATARR